MRGPSVPRSPTAPVSLGLKGPPSSSDLQTPAKLGHAGFQDGVGASPNLYLVSIFTRGAHGASGTGQPHGTLQTVSASWALWAFLALERRGDHCSKAAPSWEHPGAAQPPARGPQVGSGQLLGRDHPPGPHGSARRASGGSESSPVSPDPCTSVVNPHPSWEGLLSPRWGTEAHS